MFKLTARLLAAMALLGIAASSHAQKFSPPEQMVFAGKTYKLAFKNVTPVGPDLYEYTTDNEGIEKWSTLVTLNYFKPLQHTQVMWVEAMKMTLDQEKPRPDYSLYVKGENGYAKIIYGPDAKNRFYESNVQKTFHIADCGGRVVYQFAQKYPPSEDQSAEAKLALLKKIGAENAGFMTELEKPDWQPKCGP